LRGASRVLGPWRSAVGSLLQKLKARPPLVRLGAALSEGGTWDQLYDAFRGVFSSSEARQLAEWLTGEKIANEDADESREAPGSKRDRISAMELSRYMRNQLLRDSDVMSMAHGLELRVPLVDGALFDVVSRIPANLRLQAGKHLLLDAVPEIPEWIRSRPKTGFLFPYEQWLSSPEWQSMFAETLREVPVPTPTWYQRWSLFVFRHWQQTSGMSPSVAVVKRQS
jgi:asparagine synthase (glutamine-hydrolysing)